MAPEPVIDSIRKYLRALRTGGLPVQFGVLFGSWTNGQATADSDIDLMVVSPRFDGHYPRTAVDLLWHIAARSDSRIEPIPCGLLQWDNDQSSAIIEVARREGLTIHIDDAPVAAMGR